MIRTRRADGGGGGGAQINQTRAEMVEAFRDKTEAKLKADDAKLANKAAHLAAEVARLQAEDEARSHKVAKCNLEEELRLAALHKQREEAAAAAAERKRQEELMLRRSAMLKLQIQRQIAEDTERKLKEADHRARSELPAKLESAHLKSSLRSSPIRTPTGRRSVAQGATPIASPRPTS